MAAGVGSLTITSIPENCTIKKYVSSSWVDCSIPLRIQSRSYVCIGIFDNDGLNITKKCGLYSSDGSAFYNAGGTVEKVKDYNSAFSWYNAGYIFKVAGMDGDNNAIIRLEDSSNSIGNIPMGELTFNGVQSVTYNGTDYTKLVVDGTSYPPPLPVTISFTIKGTSYQAEVGMTWREWVASSYNTGGFICIEIADGLEYDFSLSASKNVIAESSSTSINGYAVCVLAGDGSSNATCVSPEDVINEILPYVVRGYMD